MSKGSWIRPSNVSRVERDKNWDRIFGTKVKKEEPKNEPQTERRSDKK